MSGDVRVSFTVITPEGYRIRVRRTYAENGTLVLEEAWPRDSRSGVRFASLLGGPAIKHHMAESQGAR